MTGENIAKLLEGTTVFGTYVSDSSVRFVEHYGQLDDNTANYSAQITRVDEVKRIQKIEGYWYVSNSLVCYQYLTPKPRHGCVALYLKDGSLRFVDPATDRVDNLATKVERQVTVLDRRRTKNEDKAALASEQSLATSTSVQMQKHGSLYFVTATINDANTLNFVVDSGASDVTIPADVVIALMRSGTILKSDFTSNQTYMLADGSKMPSAIFRIRSLAVGDRVVRDVRASVSPVNGILLLGQSFLSRLKSWSLDNERHVLIVE